MIVYPAVDLRGGQAVQWVGGRPETERIALPDPAAVARRWARQGFQALHLVDLDAALGRGDNGPSVEAILAAVALPVQVGGGIRDQDAVDRWLDAGAARVVVGTRGIEDAAWLERQAARRPGRIVLAADARADHVVIRGWTADAGPTVEAVLQRTAALPLAALLLTDVEREGRMGGVDAVRFARWAASSPLPLIASGGIGGLPDLHALEEAGAAGAVVGMALYTGTLDPAAAAAFGAAGTNPTGRP